MRYTRKTIDITNEKRILTGLIVSQEVCEALVPQLDFEIFESDQIATVAKWAVKHYLKYEKACNNDIVNIFNKYENKFSTAEKEAVSTLLEGISKVYETMEGEYNHEYVIDESLQYLKKRHLQIIAGNMQILLDEGKVNEAEAELINYEKIEKELSDWEDPFSENAVDSTFARKEKVTFSLRGDLGEFLGVFRSGWLTAIHGAYKLGKTNVLLEFCLISVVDLRQPTVLFSTEMQKEDIYLRMYRRLLSGSEDSEYIQYPIFDCAFNQDNSCQHISRTCRCAKPKNPQYTDDEIYHVCTICKGYREGQIFNSEKNAEGEKKRAGEYVPVVYFHREIRPLINKYNVKKRMEVIKRAYGSLLRVKTYGKYTANVGEDIIHDLDKLEKYENFVPKNIFIDMAETLKPEPDSAKIGTEKEDMTWMALAGLAQMRKCAVFTPTQVTKSGLDASIQTNQEVARWSGKLGHVDAYIALNQQPSEKEFGIMRFQLMNHRHNNFNSSKTCMVLQNIGAGQAFLDSYYERNT